MQFLPIPAQGDVYGVVIKSKYSQKDVPEIKLCGDWLQILGFQLGARVTVTSMPNLLIIRTTE